MKHVAWFCLFWPRILFFFFTNDAAVCSSLCKINADLLRSLYDCWKISRDFVLTSRGRWSMSPKASRCCITGRVTDTPRLRKHCVIVQPRPLLLVKTRCFLEQRAAQKAQWAAFSCWEERLSTIIAPDDDHNRHEQKAEKDQIADGS